VGLQNFSETDASFPNINATTAFAAFHTASLHCIWKHSNIIIERTALGKDGSSMCNREHHCPEKNYKSENHDDGYWIHVELLLLSFNPILAKSAACE